MTSFWSAIINAAILSVPLGFIVWLALRAVPRKSLNAATRYAIWWMLLAVTLALPLSFAQWQSTRTAPVLPSNSAALQMGPVSTVLVPVVATSPTATKSVAYVISLPVKIQTSRWPQPILALWIAASSLLLIRLFLSYASMVRRSARASTAPPELSSRVETWSTSRRIRVALSDEIGIPMAAGPFHPVILIPSKLLAEIGDGDLEQIGLHEAAHLTRRDDWMLFLQRIIEAVFALHPVVRWITMQIDLEREIACDDVVARSTGDARSYADCLTRMVVLCGGVQASLVAASIADSRSHLSRRVALLLARGRNNQAHLLKGRGTLIAFALLCLAALLASTPTLIAFEVPQIPTSVSVPPATTTPPIQAPVPVAPASTRKPRQIAQATPTTAVQPPNNPGIPLYVLGANDVISVKLKDDSDISGTYSIGPDGRVSMPLIGTFSAAGLTIPDLVKLITQKLNAYIVDPVVNVQLLRNNSKKYTLIGGVVRPGPHPLLQETTVLDALAASGGLKELANLKKIVVRRGSREFHFNYKEAIEGKNLEQNIALQDGDMIIVPEQDPPQEKKS